MPRQYSPEFRQRALRLLDTVMEASEVSEFEAIKSVAGKLTLRHNSRLHHLGMGRRYAGTNVLILIHDLHIRVSTTDGHLLRELQLDPTKDYQPQPKT